MANQWFQFKEFKIFQDKAAMKVGIDAVLLGAVASFENPVHVLDIGAGTGILSFMAEQRTGASITAVEIEEKAYAQCKENIQFNNKSRQIKLVHKSFQEFQRSKSDCFDHIICNPPFFNNSYKSNNAERNMARQNQMLGPEDLLKGVANLLSDTGIFSVIIPFDNYEFYMQLSDKFKIPCFKIIRIFPKQGKEVHRFILEFSIKKRKKKFDNIYIRERLSDNYTMQYRSLTKDFYLEHI